MSDYFVDTNLFLRFLTDDVPEQVKAIDRLLTRAEQGALKLHTSVLTIAEVVWTLESYYSLQPDDVRGKIIGILNTPGLHVENAELIARAMGLYVDENIDFVDAYNGLWMRHQGITRAITFDTKHFRRIPGITSLTPSEVN
ncbi:MAG: PIN domain-containing protein [Anaerolineales bacterium]